MYRCIDVYIVNNVTHTHCIYMNTRVYVESERERERERDFFLYIFDIYFEGRER
jgi:hypothetical protein